MKVTIVHGQNHQGSSYHIGRILAENITTKENITEFFLPRDCNHFCLGCYQCINDPSSCPFYTEKHRIEEALENADVMIFTTPTYCMHTSAPMKSFLDLTFYNWMVHRPKECMFHKRAAVITTAAGSSTKSALKDITTSLVYWGVPYIKPYGISVQAMNWESVSDKKKEKIKKDMQKLSQKFIVPKAPCIPLKTKFLFTMMRAMQKGNLGSSPAEKEYWQQKGWLSNKRPWN